MHSTNSKVHNSFLTKHISLKNKKDTTAESSLEEPDSVDERYNRENKEKPQRSLNFDTHTNENRLTDLCQQDKTKVGELMKRLATEREMKENLQNELQMRQLEYERTIEDFRRGNQELSAESLNIKQDFRSTMSLLNTVHV